MTAPDEPAKSPAEHAIDGAVRFAEAAVAAFSESMRRAVFESPEATEARRRIACAQRTEAQIRAIVRDEIAQAAAKISTEGLPGISADVLAWLGLLLLNGNGGAK